VAVSSLPIVSGPGTQPAPQTNFAAPQEVDIFAGNPQKPA
jgi:hypothetical protein